MNAAIYQKWKRQQAERLRRERLIAARRAPAPIPVPIPEPKPARRAPRPE